MIAKRIIACCIVLASFVARAELTEDEASQLGIEGTPLTPMGAIRNGNAEGTIPAWDGGYKGTPSGYTPGGFYVDPFADDKILFTITAQNVDQYKEHLTSGQIAMFGRYPDTYKMHIYPSRRTVSNPDSAYEATLKTARTAKLCGDRCLDPKTIGDGGGIPFPIPKNGLQVVFNAALAYQPAWWVAGSAIVTSPDGGYAVTQMNYSWNKIYWLKEKDKPTDPIFKRNGGAAYCFYATYESPARVAGQILNGCAYMENMESAAYLYIPGQRRVRKAPEVGFYDQPAAGSDGLLPSMAGNGFFMSGAEEWYDHQLLGRQEIYIPYNNYKLMDPETKPADVIRAGHISPEPVRYELHRVWVVESRIKPEFRSTIPHQFAYFDEDSWESPLATRYNQDDAIWQAQEAPLAFFYDAQAVFPVATISYDLFSGRYGTIARSFPNFMNSMVKWPKTIDYNQYTPQGLRSAGRR